MIVCIKANINPAQLHILTISSGPLIITAPLSFTLKVQQSNADTRSFAAHQIIISTQRELCNISIEAKVHYER